MSLINKMLLDLDARHEKEADKNGLKPIFEDLNPANDSVMLSHTERRYGRREWSLVLVVMVTSIWVASQQGIFNWNDDGLAMLGLADSTAAGVMDAETTPPESTMAVAPDAIKHASDSNTDIAAPPAMIFRASETTAESEQRTPEEQDQEQGPENKNPERSLPEKTKSTSRSAKEFVSVDNDKRIPLHVPPPELAIKSPETQAATSDNGNTGTPPPVMVADEVIQSESMKGAVPERTPQSSLTESHSRRGHDFSKVSPRLIEFEDVGEPISKPEILPLKTPQVLVAEPLSTTENKRTSPASSAMSVKQGVEPQLKSAAVSDRTFRAFSNEQLADNKYHSALEYYRDGHQEKAVKELKQSLEKYPRHLKARELMADIQLRQGHWMDAQQQLFKGLSISPEHYPFAKRLARLFVEQGNDSRALALLEQSRQYASDNADFLGFIAVLYQRAERHVEASKAFTQALTMKPDQGKWWLGLAISQEAEQKWREARDAYLRVQASENISKHLLDFSSQRLNTIQRHLK